MDKKLWLAKKRGTWPVMPFEDEDRAIAHCAGENEKAGRPNECEYAEYQRVGPVKTANNKTTVQISEVGD